MILTYIYDGTFEGFLTCIYESYYNVRKPEEIISTYDFEPDLLHEIINIVTDCSKADKVNAAIKNKISEEALSNIYYVFLSSAKGSDTLLYRYIKLGFKLGSGVDIHLYNEVVLDVHKISRKVGFECHNMLGFIRFKKGTNNIYYSSIEPDHNIVALLAPHFADRLSDQNWIIHDLKREIAVIYNTKEWVLVPLERNNISLVYEEDENILYETLWKNYFENIAIGDRKNPRLQKRMMPIRYWKHLTELK